jgi:hypothetical protein
VDIGIQQGQSHLTEGVGDIGLRELPVTAKVLEGLLEFIGKAGKHGGVKSRDEGRNVESL